MSESIINIKLFLEKDTLILHSDGLKLYEEIQSRTAQGVETIILSFDGVLLATTAFLNACLGKYLTDQSKVALEISDVNETIVQSKIDLVRKNASSKVGGDEHDSRSSSFLDG